MLKCYMTSINQRFYLEFRSYLTELLPNIYEFTDY